jgi:hypothetical protein
MKFRRTTYITIFLTAILGGLFIAKFTEPLSFVWLILVFVLSPLLMKRRAILVSYLLLAGVLIGWYRGGLLNEYSRR